MLRTKLELPARERACIFAQRARIALSWNTRLVTNVAGRVATVRVKTFQ